MLSQFNNFHKVTRFLSVIETAWYFMRGQKTEDARCPMPDVGWISGFP
jgi:hypothetical protein